METVKTDSLYPLHFEPIPNYKLWGGERLNTLFHKNFKGHKIGESWEISTVSEKVSKVKNGAFKGKLLTELISQYKDKLLGEKVYKKFKGEFPLLIKYIDANEDLSIQVHPDDDLARKRHNSFGKNEMWYIIDAETDAKLMLGFKKAETPENYLHHLNNETIEEIIHHQEITKGEAYFIPAGMCHAIGKGVLLAEIQQTSDITYRIYDWNRKDAEGNTRLLHTEEALDCIDFKPNPEAKLKIKKENNSVSPIINTPYFSCNNILIHGKNIVLSTKSYDSFVVYMCVSGSVVYEYSQEIHSLHFGQTILVPACMEKISFSGEGVLLQIFMDV